MVGRSSNGALVHSVRPGQPARHPDVPQLDLVKRPGAARGKERDPGQGKGKVWRCKPGATGGGMKWAQRREKEQGDFWQKGKGADRSILSKHSAVEGLALVELVMDGPR